MRFVMSLEDVSFAIMPLKVLGPAVWATTNRPPYVPGASIA